MPKLVVFLEEKSAREFLDNFLPKCLPDEWEFKLIPHEGKSDLEKSLSRKLKAWLEPDVTFMVLRDKDAGSCIDVKAKIKDICRQSGREDVIVRIACYELEAWFFGNLNKTGAALGLPSLHKTYANKAKYRNVDDIVQPSTELDKITNGKYQKMSGARAIGNCFEIGDENRSHSFNVFFDSILSLTA